MWVQQLAGLAGTDRLKVNHIAILQAAVVVLGNAPNEGPHIGGVAQRCLDSSVIHGLANGGARRKAAHHTITNAESDRDFDVFHDVLFLSLTLVTVSLLLQALTVSVSSLSCGAPQWFMHVINHEPTTAEMSMESLIF